MNAKIITGLVLLALLASAAAYVFKLRADVAELKTEVARQEELVRNREARIAGLELEVQTKGQELSAVADQTAAVVAANQELQGRLVELDDIMSTAAVVKAEPGEVLDDKASARVVRYLNGLPGAYGLREAPENRGNPSPGVGEADPVPKAVQSGFGRKAVGQP